VVERRWWWRKEEADIEAAAEDTGSSGVDDVGVESDEELESFGIKNKMTWSILLFISLKISAANLK
jgi:hypothetical protein